MIMKTFAFILLCFAFCSVSAAQTKPSGNQEYDTDTKIIYKPNVNPRLGKTVKESGYCCLVLDVNEKGQPKNITTTYCTHDRLSSYFVARTKTFRFSPALIDNTSVYRRNKTYKPGYVKYRGKRGLVVPGSNGYLKPKNQNIIIPVRPKNERAKKKWLRKYFDNKRVCLPATS